MPKTSKIIIITISISLFITFLNFNPLTRESVNFLMNNNSLTRELANPLMNNNSLTREPVNPLIINKAYATELTQTQLDQTASILSSIQSIINKLKIDIQALFGNKQASAQITDGLVGHWKFDEGAGTTAADSAGINTGALTNGPLWTTGKIGGALSFDGVNDYVSAGTTLDISSLPFSISVWVKPSSYADYGTIIAKRASYSPTQMRFGLVMNLGNGNLFLQSVTSNFNFNYSPPLNTWTHLVVVPHSGGTDLYVNGVLNNSQSAFILGTGAAAQVRIGNAPDGPDQFSGSLDDVRIYNRALIQAEITELYNFGSGTPPPSDTTPPVLSSGSPTGALPSGTTQTTLSLATNENATCKYGITPNTAYSSIANTFTTTGGTSHSQIITGFTNGTSYDYYVRCSDASGNANTIDYTISFSVAAPAGDTISPVVSITSPTNGATVSGTITVSANATDNVGIAGVQFKLDTTTNLGTEDTTSPYSYSLNTTTITDGSHTLTAVVRDTSNNYATSSIITITVNNTSPPPPDTPPSIPTGLTATAVSSSQINLSWTASTDDTGVTGYKIYRCAGSACAPTVQIATSPTTSYSDTGLTASTAYTYAVSAYDAAGNESGKSASVSATTQTSSLLQFPYDYNSGSGTTWPGWTWFSNADTYGSPGWRRNDADSYWLMPRSHLKNDTGNDDLAEIVTTDRAPSTSSGGSLKVYDTGKSTAYNAGWWWLHGNNFGTMNYADAATNRLSFYFKLSGLDDPLLGTRNPNDYSIHVGTYLCWPDASTGMDCPKETGGHFYHWLTANDNAWLNVVLDRHPQHQRGIGPAPVDNPANPRNYYQYMNSFYVQIAYPQQSLTSYQIDEMQLYTAQQPENDISISSVWTGYWPATDKWEIGFNDSSFGSYNDYSGSTFEIRYSATPITNENFSLATPITPEYHQVESSNLIRRPNSWKSVAWTRFQLPDSFEAANNHIYFAIKDVSVNGGHVGSWPYQNGDGHDAPSPYIKTIDYYLRANAEMDITPPAVPGNLTAATISSSQINLSWTASTDDVGVTGYKIYRCAGSACAPTVQIATSTTNFYSDTGLTASTAYTYAVSAYDSANNESAKSSSVSATTLALDTTPPTVSITSLTSGQTVSGTIIVSADVSDNVGVSGVQFKLDGVNLGAEDTTSPYSISWNTAQTSNGSHTLLAIARDASGNRATSSPIIITTNNDTTPPTISSVISTTLASTTARIDWQTNEPATSQVEYGFTTQYGASSTLSTTLTTSHSVSLSNLSPDNTTYNYRVRSKDSSNNESISTNNTFITSGLTDIIPPASTTNLTANNITQTSVDLVTWTASGDDGNQGTASSFDIRYATGELSENTWNNSSVIRATGEPTPKIAGSIMNYTLVGLTPNTTYKVALKTLDEVPNQSLISNIITFTTLKAETAPAPTPAPAPAPAAPSSGGGGGGGGGSSSSGGGGGGGGGGSSTISDTTPAPKITDLKAQGADKQVRLTWKNPESSDWVRTILVRKAAGFATSTKDGQVVFEGTEREFTDVNLKNNQNYYYSLFTIDRTPNYSKPATIMVKTIALKVSLEEIKPAPITAREQEVLNLAAEAAEIIKSNIISFLTKFNFKRDQAKEDLSLKQYVKELIKGLTDLMADRQIALNHFIAYGTATTLKLGAGERAGVVNSYKSAFNKLPATAEEWTDAIKIANGRWPTERSAESENNATTAFKKIYKRSSDRKNPHDDAAVTVMAYGLRPDNRNLNSERAAIKSFRAIYGYTPISAVDWDIVRAIAYSGAKR